MTGRKEKEDRILAAVFACNSEDCPRPFALYRQQDMTGVSGEGTVAHGVQFADGQVVIRWLGEYASTVIWDSLDAAMKVHGHDGRTRVVWVATDFSEMAKAEQEAAAAERQRIVKLAEEHHARYRRVNATPAATTPPTWNVTETSESFADLIREAS